jgi:type I restriction enzyme, S subunit
LTSARQAAIRYDDGRDGRPGSLLPVAEPSDDCVAREELAPGPPAPGPGREAQGGHVSKLPRQWTLATLGSVADWGSGGTPKAATRSFYGGDIPWAVIGDLTDGIVSQTAGSITDLGLRHSSAKIVDSSSVLIAMYGSIGKLGLPAMPMATNQAIAFARPRPDVLLREYLFFYLMHARASLAAAGQGAAQQNISQTILKSCPIPVAPLAEQKRIVAAIEEQFSRVDAGVAALERTRRNLRRMRGATINALLCDPAGQDWEHRPLGDVLLGGRYGTSTKCGYDGRGLPVLRIPNIQAGQVDLRDLKRALDVTVDLGSTRIEADDVLIIRTNGSRGLIGRAAVVPAPDEPMSFASYLIQLRLDRDRLLPEYFVTALSAPRMRERVEELAATTAGQYNISLGKLRSLHVPVPPLDDQRALTAGAQRQLSLIGRLESELRQLGPRHDQLRSAILATAFSGNLVPQDPADEPVMA